MSNETENLIEIVREHRVLYDLAHPEYKNIKKKDKVWDEIGKTSGKNGDDLKKKWKNLRDSYSKYLRTEKTHSGQETKILDRYKTWPWAQQMEFLRPFLQFSKTDSNVTNQPHHEQRGKEDDNTVEVTEKEQEVSQQSQPLRENNPAVVQQTTPQSTRKRKLEEKPSQPTSVQQVLTYLEKRQSNTNSGLDELDLICMGYAKTIKKFSPRRQAMVKFNISQILLEAELAQETEDQQKNKDETAPLFTRPSSSASAVTSLSDSSLFSPAESDIYSNSVPGINVRAHSSASEYSVPGMNVRAHSTESWYGEFGSSLNNYEEL